MIFSYDWLKTFVPDILPPEELEEKLTMHTVEVEGVMNAGKSLEGIVVGKLLSIEKHPDADRLAVCSVDIGKRKPETVVCGGSNLVEGHAYAFGTIGAQVQWHGEGEPIILQEAKIRGVKSRGMICAAEEIGLGDVYPKKDEKEVLDITDMLGKNVVAGEPLADALHMDSILIDIDNKSMTHRADLFSHRGMGREISAVLGIPFSDTEIPSQSITGKPSVSVRVQEPDLCQRYALIECEVDASVDTPQEIVKRLQECGVQRINVVVDILNYVMCELGQPMHAFDADAIEGNIIVRKAKGKEELETLDNDTKKLNSSMLLIADTKKPLAIAGVIGGMHTGVTKNTKKVYIEIAHFEAVSTRKTAQAIGVRTESSLRYEKGLPLSFIDDAKNRVLALLTEHAKANVLGILDSSPDAAKTSASVTLSQDRLNTLTGMEWDSATVTEYLERIECAVDISEDKGNLSYICTPPLHRSDLSIPEDIVEEIVKLYGVNNIPDQQLNGALHVPSDQPEITMREKLRTALLSFGYSEIYSYSMYGADTISKMGYAEDAHVEIANPLSGEARFLRANMLPRMLQNVSRNKHNADTLKLFEIGHVFFADREVQHIGIIMTGDQAFRSLRGMVESLMNALSCEYECVETSDAPSPELWGQYAVKQSMKVLSGKTVLGTFGVVDQGICKQWNIEDSVYFAVFSIPALTQAITRSEHIAPIPQFPAIPLDLSLIVDVATPWGSIEEVIRKTAGDLLESIDVFDVFTGEKIPSGKKSIACSLILRSRTETLQMAAMEKLRNDIVARLNKKYGAELRGE